MKRGKPLRRKSRLVAKSTLRRSEFRSTRRPSIAERSPDATAAVEVRSMGRCECCGWEADHFHHRKLQSQGGPDTVENLVHVCGACHRHIHANPAESYENGLLIRRADPDPIDPWSYS